MVPMDRWIAVSGFSGSPLLDRDDRVVGVLDAADENMASAVRLERVHDVLDRKVQRTACREYASLKTCLEAAVESTMRAANAGDVLAQFQLGWEVDMPGHVEWLTRAAGKGFADAQARLGDHYRIAGNDLRKAAHW